MYVLRVCTQSFPILSQGKHLMTALPQRDPVLPGSPREANVLSLRIVVVGDCHEQVCRRPPMWQRDGCSLLFGCPTIASPLRMPLAESRFVFPSFMCLVAAIVFECRFGAERSHCGAPHHGVPSCALKLIIVLSIGSSDPCCNLTSMHVLCAVGPG